MVNPTYPSPISNPPSHRILWPHKVCDWLLGFPAPLYRVPVFLLLMVCAFVTVSYITDVSLDHNLYFNFAVLFFTRLEF